MTEVLRAEALWKVYDTGSVQVKALKGVDLTVDEGEMVALMGPSGCGKTTFLNCVSSLDEFTAGEVFINGDSLSTMSDKVATSMRANEIGFVFQSFNLIPVLSAVENVEIPLMMQGVSPKSARTRALDALEKVGLREWAGHLPAELSGGQQQRVTIARAFVHQPAVILADEPTGNLDSETSDMVMNILVELNRKHGITFVIVTHAVDIASFCPRIVKINDGQIISDETVASSETASEEE